MSAAPFPAIDHGFFFRLIWDRFPRAYGPIWEQGISLGSRTTLGFFQHKRVFFVATLTHILLFFFVLLTTS